MILANILMKVFKKNNFFKKEINMKVLIASADQILLSKIKELTSTSNFEISEVSDIQSMRSKLESTSESPQILIVDVAIGEFDPDNSIKKLHSYNDLQRIVILLMDSDLKEGIMYEKTDGLLSISMNRSQPSDILSLLNFGTNYLQLNNELSAQKKKCQGLEIENKQLKQSILERSRLDELTGILNRKHLFEMGEKEIRRAKRYNHSLSLLMIDIDHFKRINDNYGHIIGDRVLQSFSQKCYSTIRESDFFGRIGGEEFVAILTESNKESCMMASERIRKTIERMGLETEQGVIQYTISIGATTMMPFDHSLDDLLVRADKALFSSKTNGRNRSCFYEV